jgi:hypothetical protein
MCAHLLHLAVSVLLLATPAMTSVYSILSEGPVPTSHSGIPTPDVYNGIDKCQSEVFVRHNLGRSDPLSRQAFTSKKKTKHSKQKVLF